MQIKFYLVFTLGKIFLTEPSLSKLCEYELKKLSATPIDYSTVKER